jgi:hypothetical protein
MFPFLIKGVELKDGLVRQDVIYGDRHEKGGRHFCRRLKMSRYKSAAAAEPLEFLFLFLSFSGTQQ